MAKIYALKNMMTGEAYIGCTKGKIAKRLREHRCLLRSGKHTCKPLQEAWDTHGETSFSMIVEDECADDLASRRAAELRAMERYSWRQYNEEMNSFRPTNEAIRKGIEASRHVVGNRWTPEANLKRSLAQKGKPKGHGAKISATKQARKAQQVMI
jgi:hypothetical protein